MKICIFVNELSLSAGGVENTAFLIFEEMKSASAFVKYRNDSDTSDVYYAYPKGMLLKYFISLRQYLRKFKSKEKVFNLAFSWQNAIIPYIAKVLFHTPYGVLTFGNDVLPDTRRFNSSLRKHLLDKANVLFATSSYTAEITRNETINSRIEVINPCIKYRDICANENTTYRMFTVGRLVERKGVQYVIQAVRKVVETIPQISYIVAGDGEYRGKLEQLANELGLTDYVKFLGKISEEEKDKQFYNCDIFITTSLYIEKQRTVEGFGIVFLEANMYGKPVIASRSGGIPDAVKDGVNGFLVEPCNPDEIAEAIIKFYNGEIEIKKENCKQIAAEHDVSVITARYRAIIEKTLEET